MQRKKALELVKESVLSLGAEEDQIEAEITEESSFNMVRGFFTSGKKHKNKGPSKTWPYI